MKLSSSLLAKVAGGLVAATTLTTVGIVKRESISGFFVPTPVKVKNKLLEHLKTTGKDIVFKAYSGETGKIALNGDFPSFENKSQTVRFSIETTDSLTGDSGSKTTNELKGLLGTKGDLIWECKIKFNTIDTNKSWKGDEKDIFYKEGSGFLQKITTSGHKLFKERFIKQCSDSNKENKVNNGSIKLEKQFNLSVKGSNLEIKEKEKSDYKSWFGKIKLTEKEVEVIKDNWNFSLSKAPTNKLTLSDIKTKDEKISGCEVNLEGSEASSKSNDVFTFLGKLFNHENSINREKYREGFLKKCRDNENSLTLTLESGSEINKKLNELFDFSRELSKKIYESVKVTNKTMSIENKTVKITVSTVLNNQKYECKIIGAPEEKSSEDITFDESDLKMQMSSLGTIVTEIGWKNWLKKCRDLFNDEITFQLKKKTDGTNKYDLGSIALNSN